MKELGQLKAMWERRSKRSTKLLVSKSSLADRSAVLNRSHWEYVVPRAFMEALDIKYEERRKLKKPYMTWTQGPILKFKSGDVFTARSGRKALQVRHAARAGWDTVKNEMYAGYVDFDEYEIFNGKYSHTGRADCDQMQFLEILIGVGRGLSPSILSLRLKNRM